MEETQKKDPPAHPSPGGEEGAQAMHEAAIVGSLIAILNQQARLHDVKRVRRVNLKVGQLTAVEPQALVS